MLCKRIAIYIICLILMVLTACNSANSLNNGSQGGRLQADDIKSYSLPSENRRGYNPLFESCPASTTNGYYRANTVSKTLWYFDAETEKGFFLCSQVGCAHNDEACQAWIGDVTGFTEYCGNIIAIRKYEDGSIDLAVKDLSSGKIKILEKWKGNDKDYYEAFILRVANDNAVICLWHYVLKEEGAVLKTEESAASLKYNIKTGEKTEMFLNENAACLNVLAFSEKNALVKYMPENELGISDSEPVPDSMDYGTYKETKGGNVTFSEWERYYFSEKKQELRLYDINTFKYTVVTDTANRGWIPSPSNAVYGEKAVYMEDNTVYLLDITNGKSSRFITVDNLSNCSLFDHKVFITTEPAPEEYHWQYADLENNDSLTVYNNLGHTDVMQFSIMSEGDGFFIDSGGRYLSKKDFYTENYSEYTAE